MPQTEYNARLKLYFPCITTELDITRIGEAAFMGLDALTEVEIADSVTSIGAYAFNYCGMLTKFEFPKNISEIEKLMFWGCDSLSEVVIPEGVTTIGERAFDGCESLKTLSIPSKIGGCTVTAIADNAKLPTKNIVIPRSVTSIGKNLANSYCEYLSVESNDCQIDSHAFDGISGIVELKCGVKWTAPDGELSANVQQEPHTFDNGVCSECGAYVPDGTYIAGDFEIQIKGENVTITGYTGDAEELDIPSELYRKTVTAIGEKAFEECEFTSVTFPETVATIGNYAFLNCEKLKKAHIPDTNVSVGAGACVYGFCCGLCQSIE